MLSCNYRCAILGLRALPYMYKEQNVCTFFTDSMVSKERQKRQKKKQWDTKNDKKKHRDFHSWYVENKHKRTVIERAKNRMLSDKTMRKQNIQRVKARLLNDIEYRNINSLRATMKKERKRIHPESRERELAKKRIRTKKTVE